MKKSFVVNLFISIVTGTVLFLGLMSTAQAYSWYTYGGHDYALTENDFGTWLNAEAEAISVGGHLVTINDAAENAWVAQTFQDPTIVGNTTRDYPGNNVFYIGYYFNESSAQWQWTSGEPVTYTNLLNIPNSYSWYTYGGNQAYLYSAVIPAAPEWAYQWNHNPVHTDGTFPFKGLIERTTASVPEPVPEPTTMLLLGSGLAGLAAFRKRFKRTYTGSMRANSVARG